MAKGINIFNSSDTENIEKAIKAYQEFLEETSGFEVSIGKEEPKKNKTIWFDTSKYE